MKADRQAQALPRLRSNPSTAVSILILAVVAVIAYWNSFNVPMVFDDLPSIQKNAGVQFGDYLRPEIGMNRPLLYVTFTINYLLHQERVWGYHLVNLILHLLTGIVIFFVASNIFSRIIPDESRVRLYSLLAASFFLLHPIQTESVTYISSRSESMSTLFFALGVLIFLKRSADGIGFLWSLVVLIPFLLGLGSKETVITLPATLVLIDFLFLSGGQARPVLKRWTFYATFVVGGVAAAYFLITRILTGSIGPGLQGHLSRYEYFLTQIRVIVSYARLVVLPVDLNLDYDVRPSTSIFEPAVILSLLFLGGLIALAWILRKKEPVLSFAILWFFITLSPTSSFIPILDTMFEHRLYLPMVAICLAFPILADRLFQKRAVAACIAALLALTVATIRRNAVWQSDLTLWADVVAKSPAKARGYNSLALGHFKRAQYDKAIVDLKLGMDHVSGKMDRRSFTEALGNMYLQLGRLQEAAAAFEETTQVDDAAAAALGYNNLGNAYMRIYRELEQRRAQLGEAEFQSQARDALGKAEAALVKSVQLNPSLFWPYDLYIDVVFTSGQANLLVDQMQNHLLKQKDARAYYAIGKIAMLRKDYNTAAAFFKDATALDPAQKVMYFNYAYVLERLQRLEEAKACYTQALRLDPLFGDAHHNLGLIYSRQRNFPSALNEFEASLRLNPTRQQTHLEMAKIFIETGNRQQAREHLSQVLSVSPQDPEARQLLQMIGS